MVKLRDIAASNQSLCWLGSHRRGSALILVMALLGILFITGMTFLMTMNFEAELLATEQRASGEGEAREVSVIGETPNIAARLQGLAKPDSVVIGPATKHLVNDVFELENIGSHQLKGISSSLDVWAVQPDALLQGSLYGLSSTNLTRFSVRENELEHIEDSFVKVRSGDMRIVSLAGEDGIGKSRLISQFIEQHQNETLECWKGQCSAVDQMTPYFVFIQCLRQELKVNSQTETAVLQEALKEHMKLLGLSSKENAPYLLNLLDARSRPQELVGMSSDVIARGTKNALKNFIVAKAKFVPLVLVVEDAHWIDSGSEGFIEELIESQEKAQLLILCSFRSDYSAPWNKSDKTTLVSVLPLSRGGIKSFLQEGIPGSFCGF